MLEIEMFPARNGDGLWLRYGDEDDPKHILIDCGFASTTTPHVVQRLVDKPKTTFELFMLTHIDGDHIDGGIQLLLDEVFTRDRAKDIWFNGWQHIADIPEDDDELGGRQGEYFAAVLKDKKLPWNKAFNGERIVVKPDELPTAVVGGMKLTVLSPDGDRLRRLRTKWKADLKGVMKKPGSWKEALDLLRDDRRYASDALGDDPDIATLAGVDFEEDDAAPNGSSIAVLAEWGDYKLLLLGDAFPTVVAESLRRLGHSKTNKLHVHVLKLSHHGSAGNTSPELLELLTYDHVLISTNGDTHSHPHPHAIARCLHGRDGVTLHFNYDTKFTQPWLKLAKKTRSKFKAFVGVDGAYTLTLP